MVHDNLLVNRKAGKVGHIHGMEHNNGLRREAHDHHSVCGQADNNNNNSVCGQANNDNSLRGQAEYDILNPRD